LLSAFVALLCATASVCRLRWAVAPTALDPVALRQIFAAEDAWPALSALRDALAGRSDLTWEHDLFAAFTEQNGSVRDARVNEQLTELDGRADRWGRVPRVCASIATSAGFLFATITLLGAMAPAVNTEQRPDAVMATLVPALNALAAGMAGTSFCAAVHVRARKARRRRMSAMDRLVERLQVLAARANESDARSRPT
jgi:hypothetical protein